MGQKLLGEKSLVALVLVVLLGLTWTACSTVKESPGEPAMGQDTQGGKYYFFDDVLIPKELNYKASKSFVFETPKFKAGSLVFSKWRADIEPLMNFFTYHMGKDNWKLDNSFRGKDSYLNFSKPDKSCTIKIVDKWFGFVEVEVQVIPL
jgi:hypothetical protein